MQTIRYEACTECYISPAIWSASAEPTAWLQHAVEFLCYKVWLSDMFEGVVANDKIDACGFQWHVRAWREYMRLVQARILHECFVHIDTNHPVAFPFQRPQVATVNYWILPNAGSAARAKVEHRHLRSQ